jgi:hypothetical protein
MLVLENDAEWVLTAAGGYPLSQMEVMTLLPPC